MYLEDTGVTLVTSLVDAGALERSSEIGCEACPLLALPDELIDSVLAALARSRLDEPGAIFRAARTCRRIHQAALVWICHVEPSTFGHRGPGIELVHGGSAVRQTENDDAFALAGVVMRSGSASATFRPVFEGSYSYQIGVFPADLRLDSNITFADGKRCALYVSSASGGWARVHCDGVRSDLTTVLGLRPGDTIDVDVTFEGGAALVTFYFKGKTKSETLQGVPECGLRFGAGMYDKDSGVTLVASTGDAGVRVFMGIAGCTERTAASHSWRAPYL